jgi:hypothetical protein
MAQAVQIILFIQVLSSILSHARTILRETSVVRGIVQKKSFGFVTRTIFRSFAGLPHSRAITH